MVDSVGRGALRQRLRDARERFAASPAWPDDQQTLAGHLSAVLAQLAPSELGLYWPLPGEFNAATACLADHDLDAVALALPFARRAPKAMEYRHWDRREPTLRDECGIASTDGRVCVPEVVLVPCVGFTREGYRLGYGGGYFDRWLAAHPHVTAVGVAWSVGEISVSDFAPQPHDRPLMLVVDERGVVGG